MVHSASRTSSFIFLLHCFVLSQLPFLTRACSVCVALPLHTSAGATSPSTLALTAVTRFAEQKPILVFATLASHRLIQQHREKSNRQRQALRRKHYVKQSNSEGQKDGDASAQDDDSDAATTGTEKESLPLTTAMIASIGFYKKVISPLLPPACRFLPTCSQYGVQAIEQFGPQKGAILTAWRILRCSPFGGKGYDPPRWPPVAYTYGSY